MALDAIDGKVVVIRFDGETFVGQRVAGANLSTDELDTTTKGSDLWKESIGGERSGTITLEGITPLDGATASTFSKIFTYWKNGDIAQVEYVSINTNTIIRAQGFITSITFNANKNEPQAYQVEFQLTGEIFYN
ncbi:MAG: phage tail tube protein [Candidatus Anstonellaceae archaeon]